MKKISLLSASIALALSGCGSDGGGSTNATSTTLTAIDGYLVNASVYADSNNNLVLDNEDSHLGETDENGQFDLPEAYDGMTIFIEAVANQTTDTNRGIIESTFTLADSGNNNVISPITNMVTELLLSDSSLTLETAQQQVVDSISALGIDPSIIFSDYLENNVNLSESDSGIALNIIGEQLVDADNVSITRKLELAAALANDLQDIIEDSSSSLDSTYYPVIEIPSDEGNAITLTSNHRAETSDTLDKIILALDEDFTMLDVSSYFIDPDNDQQTYSISEINGQSHGLSIDQDGVISGTLPTAGSYHFQIIATDENSAKSYPLNLEIEVTAAGNELPVLSESEHERIQSEIDNLSLYTYDSFGYVLYFNDLFTDDDQLSYSAESSLMSTESGASTGFTISIGYDNSLIFSAPPREADTGEETITIWASDGVHAQQTAAIFTLPAIQKGDASTTIENILESRYWHYANTVMNDDNQTSQIICETIYFDQEAQIIYYAEVGTENTSDCASQERASLDTSTAIAYTKNSSGTITSSNYSEDGIFFAPKVFTTSGVDSEDETYALTVTGGTRDPETDEMAYQSYTFHSYASPVEKTLLQAVSFESEFDWDYNNVYEEVSVGSYSVYGLDIRAAIQQTEVDGVIQTSATLRNYNFNAAKCAILNDVYAVGATISGPEHFTSSPEFTQEQDVDSGLYYCSLTWSGPSGIELPQGTYIIEAAPVDGDARFDDKILFSFINE